MLDRPITICSAICCPYWNGESQGYGCQRYNVAFGCHLRQRVPELQANEYTLFSQQESIASSIDQLKAANEQFFREDSYYADERSFLAEFPELKEGRFVPREIDHLDSPR